VWQKESITEIQYWHRTYFSIRGARHRRSCRAFPSKCFPIRLPWLVLRYTRCIPTAVSACGTGPRASILNALASIRPQQCPCVFCCRRHLDTVSRPGDGPPSLEVLVLFGRVECLNGISCFIGPMEDQFLTSDGPDRVSTAQLSAPGGRGRVFCE
jgi:hypothetical protein